MMYEVDDSLIRALIFERGLTVAQFARRAGINCLTARKVLKGGAKVNGRIVSLLAKCLGVPGNDLIKEPQNG